MSDKIHGCHICFNYIHIWHICHIEAYKAYNRFAMILKSDITNVKGMTQAFAVTEMLLLA